MHRDGDPLHAGDARRAQRIAIFALFFALGLATAALGAALPSLRQAYALGDRGGGWLVSAYNLGALAAILGCGFARLASTRARALRLLLAAFALGALAMGRAGSWAWFCAATAVTGAGYGGLVLYLNSMVARQFRERSFRMLSFVNGMFGVGAIAGPLLVGITGRRAGAAFLAAGLLALAALPAIAAMAGGGLAGDPPASGPARSGQRLLVSGFFGLGLLYSGLETGVGAWEATHLAWSGHTAAQAARWTALFWGGLCLGRFAIAPLVGDRAPQALIRAALLAALGALLVAAQPLAAPYAYAACGLFLAPVFPAVLQWIARDIENNQAANAALFTASMLGSAAVPTLIGVVADPGRPARVPLALAGLALLGAAAAQSLARLACAQLRPRARVPSLEFAD